MTDEEFMNLAWQQGKLSLDAGGVPVGSILRDGRDVLVALDTVRRETGLDRLPDGRYRLAGTT